MLLRDLWHVAVAGTVLIAGTVAASAGEPDHQGTVASYFTDRYGLEIGAKFTTNDTRARADSSTKDRGTTIDLEDGLGLDDNSYIPVLHAYWRMTKRWRLDLSYARLHRDGERSAETNIEWGDLDFAANARLASDFNLDVFKFSAGYTFYQTERAEAGLSAGLVVSRYEAGLSGALLVGGFATESYKFPAPLPTIGLYGAYALTPKLLLRGRVDYFDIDIGIDGWDVGGRILDVHASVEYQLRRHLSLGAGYRYLDYEVRGENSDFRGELEYRLSGPYVFSRVSF